jgi:hypothetical protein
MATKNRAAGIASLVTWLAEAFSRSVTQATFRAYELGLDGIPLERIEAAVRFALQTCKFMPSPAELRELAGEMRLSERAIHAWTAFERAVVSQTSYRTVDFDDPVINATVRSLGGWQFCCQMDSREFDTFLREKFLKTYAALSSSGITAEQSAPLIGTFDADNAREGHSGSIKEPIRIDTGLPGLPVNLRMPKRADAPRLELKRP